MKNIDSIGHVSGSSLYLDDIPVQMGTLYGVVFDSTIAHGLIENIDYSEALKLDGIVHILTYQDIPGQNEIGGIVADEPLLAEKKINYCGQPIALIIGTSTEIAKRAKELIKIKYQKKKVITEAREASKNNSYIIPSRTFKIGNVKDSFDQCTHIFKGQADTNGQEHLYLETQGAYAVPLENGQIKVTSSTQGPTIVQRTAAKVLNVGMHKIEVDVLRLGGGFGGKEDQATPWATLAILGVHILQKPVKIVLHRMEDMRMTGKRHPYTSDYKIGLSKDLKILAYEVKFYQNAGASADLSPAVLERTLFHATNAYFIPNVCATAYCCKTNLPPNTAFRGFGGPQGMFVIESAISHAACALGIKKELLQKNNLINNGDVFPYGQIAKQVSLSSCYEDLAQKYELVKLKDEIQKHNTHNDRFKKGYSIMPICFGISFTKTHMNQARALVHIYSDGSIGISSGAVEMGQGVNTKLLQIASSLFGVNPDRVKIESTNTTRVANTSPSAASATADLNGKALEKACNSILHRLKKMLATEHDVEEHNISIEKEYVHINGEKIDLHWCELINSAFLKRICLSQNGHYATPNIHYDKAKENGHPFAYHVFGVSLTTITLDCLKGTFDIDSVEIVHDFGKSMNMDIDMGQIEGGLVQGIGWMTMEEVCYDANGVLLSNTLSTYKIPDIYSVPKSIKVTAYEGEEVISAMRNSKAVGEPPLMYGIGTYFAIQDAILAFNKNLKPIFDAPYTHEKILMDLYD